MRGRNCTKLGCQGRRETGACYEEKGSLRDRGMTSFKMRETKGRVGGAGGERKRTGLHKVQKVETREELCRRWYGVSCVQKGHVD